MTIKWKKIKRKIFGFLSFSAALFIFQACYGAPQDYEDDVLIQGTVKSDSTGLPVQGIRVSFDNNQQYGITDSNGTFSFYVMQQATYPLSFEDSDSSNNGLFATLDTIIEGTSTPLEITLEQIP